MTTPITENVQSVVLSVLLYLFSFRHINALHLTGKWEPDDDNFLFLTKFAFQKTVASDQLSTLGVIYGNLSSNARNSSNANGLDFATLAVLDGEYFAEYYFNATYFSRNGDHMCQRMFSKLTKKLYDPRCFPHGKIDFTRAAPCPTGQLCREEDNPKNIIQGSQFTYRIADTFQARFWYVSLSRCIMDSKCKWVLSKPTSTLTYDIWLVNGDPSLKKYNPFEHQFSFVYFDTFEIFAAFSVFSLIFLSLQIYAYRKKPHKLPLILTISLGLKLIYLIFNVIHLLVFAGNGVGLEWLASVASAANCASLMIFFLMLLLIGKGYAITRDGIERPRLLVCIWSALCLTHLVLFICIQFSVDTLFNPDEWQTRPGIGVIGVRMIFMIWFVYEVQATFAEEQQAQKLRFYLHFGAATLVWFISLPITVAVSTQISALWRHKFIFAIYESLDMLAYAVLIQVMWPTRNTQYFNYVIRKHQYNLMSDNLESRGFLESDDEQAGLSLNDFASPGGTPTSPKPTATFEDRLCGKTGNDTFMKSRNPLADSENNVTPSRPDTSSCLDPPAEGQEATNRPLQGTRSSNDTHTSLVSIDLNEAPVATNPTQQNQADQSQSLTADMPRELHGSD